MKALSIKQPHAWLIASGIKDVENRSWRTKFRGRVYIHAGKVPDSKAPIFVDDDDEDEEIEIPDSYYGAIIGEVDIIDCVQDSKSVWAVPGQYHFILANPVLYETPVPCRGQLGFFEVKDGKTEYSERFRSG